MNRKHARALQPTVNNSSRVLSPNCQLLDVCHLYPSSEGNRSCNASPSSLLFSLFPSSGLPLLLPFAHRLPPVLPIRLLRWWSWPWSWSWRWRMSCLIAYFPTGLRTTTIAPAGSPLYLEAEKATPQRSSQLTDADSLSDLPNPNELLPARSRL